jgi:hypothetical protein
MFLRWKKRRPPLARSFWARRNEDRNESRTLLTAVLVEAVRIDGRPRQKIVKYLGSIQEWRIEQRAYQPLHGFWQTVLSRLDTLTLSKKERREIERQVADVVPKPTKAMLRADRKSLTDLTKRIANHGA